MDLTNSGGQMDKMDKAELDYHSKNAIIDIVQIFTLDIPENDQKETNNHEENLYPVRRRSSAGPRRRG